MILEDDTQSLNHVLEVVELFSTCSSLRASFNKTQALWIGARRGCGEDLQTNKPIKRIHSGAFELLGIQYSLHKLDSYIDNFTQKIEQIQRLLGDCFLRNISLIGKVTVIKTLALPILVQLFTVLPDPPIRIVKKFQDIFFNFLWNNKVNKVKGNSGLKMPHVLSFVHALNISWIKRVLDPDNYAPWKVLLTDVLDDLGQEKC
jgi:hypothetical protein